MPDYLVNLALDILTPILLALGSWAVAEVALLIRTRIKNEQLSAALSRATHTVELGVGEIQQTVVDRLKAEAADGKLTADEARMALNSALTVAKSHLGPKGAAELKTILGGTDKDLETYLISLIEARIAKAKP